MRPAGTRYVVEKSTHPEAGIWLSEFSFPWREEEAPSTRFRARHGEGWLHFVFDVIDADLVVGMEGDEVERVLGSDRVELFFADAADLSGYYYGLEMDPAGRVYDYRARTYRQFDPHWRVESLDFRSEIVCGGYRVEGQIAMEELAELGCLRGNEMVAGVYRAEFSHGPDGEIRQDWISWIDPETPHPDFHVASSFGRFAFA